MTLILTMLAIFRMVVIPVQFEDKDMERSASDRAKLITTAESYFNSQFKDRQQFSFAICEPVRVSNKESYYGGDFPEKYDIKLDELILEAVKLAGPMVDFKIFCNNKGDEVDHVMFLTAGLSQDEGGGADCIYPRTARLSDYGKKLTVQGCKIDSFSVCSEYSTGVFCHEFCHFLGLPDFYDTDGEASGGLSEGLQDTSIMDDGCKKSEKIPSFNAIELELLQLGQESVAKPGLNTLPVLEKEQKYLRLRTDNSNEYYLIEYREQFGLTTYHIDKSDNDAGFSHNQQKHLTAAERWQLNEINCRPEKMCTRITDKLQGSGFSIKDMNIEGDRISFTIFEPISITKILVFQDGAIIQWHMDPSLENLENIQISLLKDDETVLEESLRADATSCTFDRLTPGSDYKFSIEAVGNEGQRYLTEGSFTTKNAQPLSRPYIYLNDTPRNSDGTFAKGSRSALRVANAEEAVSVSWTMNGRPSTAGSDGLHKLENGVLKARIEYPDGSILYITKEIILR